MAKQFTNSVKIIQSDGGGEFVNTVLQTHFAANGIIHRLSCPGTPEQNGLAERRHRHIVETSLTLLAHASVPVKYWTAAFNTAVFLINRLPSSVLDHMSPHELAFGSSPNYDFLRVFGCSCYPLLSPFGRTKLEYKSICCVFLGYSANIRDTVALNHIQAASILADMSDLMSSIFHSRMLQPLIPLVVNFFNYKHFPHLFRILLYITHLLVHSLLEWLL